LAFKLLLLQKNSESFLLEMIVVREAAGGPKRKFKIIRAGRI